MKQVLKSILSSIKKAKEISKSLEGLALRNAIRFADQPDIADLLPSEDVDLILLTKQIVSCNQGSDNISGRRADMKVQLAFLTRSHTGKSELCLYHALAISYLRRNTPYTSKALTLFRRMWSEHAEYLARELDTRWLISALQTFYDHGYTTGERTAGGMGFTYGNMIKVYETEFAAIVRDGDYGYGKFQNISVPTMYGFKPGDDILININTIMYDAALEGDLAREPMLELLKRIKQASTVFKRIDTLRDHKEFSEHPTYTLSFDGRFGDRKK